MSFDALLPFVIAILLVPYVVRLIWIRFWLRVRPPDVVQFDAADPDLPPEVARHFRKVTKALQPVGFDVVSGLAMPNEVPKVKSWSLLLVNRGDDTIAMASVYYIEPAQGGRLHSAHVTLKTHFAGGALVRTDNANEFSDPGPVADRITTQFPMVQNPARLYELHKALVETHGRDLEKMLPLDDEFNGDAVAYQTRAYAKEIDESVSIGRSYFARREGVYLPTWKGAMVLSWQHTWFQRAVRRYRRERKARRLLAELTH
jgi:hypothetical protein